MAKCKCCGVQIARGEVLCHSCTEEIKHKRSEVVLPPSTGSNVKPSEEHINKVNNELAMQSNVRKCWWDDTEKLFHCVMRNGSEWTSEKGDDKWTRVPKVAEVKEEHNDSLLPQIEAQLYAQTLESPWGDLPPTQQKIHEIMGAMKDLLLYKNQKYGDSAINPKKIFYKGNSTNSILIRLDDKIGRVMSNTEEKPRVNDVCDIIGYCVLLLISMGVTSGDIAKFKD